MPVPERVPLPLAQDRAQRVVLQTAPGAIRAARSASAARWSAACIRPKQSTITSACPPSGDGTSPRPASMPSQDPPCGLPYSVTTPRAGSRPAKATCSTACAACSTSAADSAPLGSSGTVGSARSWARPHDEHSHIWSGYTGSGPGSPAAGK